MATVKSVRSGVKEKGQTRKAARTEEGKVEAGKLGGHAKTGKNREEQGRTGKTREE